MLSKSVEAFGTTAEVRPCVHDRRRFVSQRKSQNPNGLIPQRINNRQKRKTIKIRVPSANFADPVLAHQNRSVDIVHHIATQLRMLGKRLI